MLTERSQTPNATWYLIHFYEKMARKVKAIEIEACAWLPGQGWK
jgi:hypothetical protein